MIQDRQKKVEEIRQSVELMKTHTQREIEESVQVFAALLRSVERSQAELIALIEEKQRAEEKRAEGLITELEQEIAELQTRSTELEQLSHSGDQIHFLQRFLSLCSPSPPKKCSDNPVHADLSLGMVRNVVAGLEARLHEEIEKLPEIKLKRIRKYAADVTLDPGTAHPNLVLSEDGKRVRHRERQQVLPDNPERFDQIVRVLGREGFTSGRHYWEVAVGGKTKWDLGVARASVTRNSNLGPELSNGYWALLLREGNTYFSSERLHSSFSLSPQPQKVGVYLDYEAGEVSFYNVEAGSHIHTFRDTFAEKLHPYFNTCLWDGGTSAAPLIISPVTQTN
ncbi:E3 ubiquitin-protein ligase TRIM39-like [Lepisosteus oculatus]|uniref:E3 ubiquitin-protein ligase TRIM39-like n=1 Tax=Lepisosteus oculatus TaxID=7918 RepID=W5M360_LEPOC|nr:PREDICTED: E3 ubiquitin-protein ligase TRIM39-like [Lepisosteus oculatus]